MIKSKKNTTPTTKPPNNSVASEVLRSKSSLVNSKQQDRNLKTNNNDNNNKGVKDFNRNKSFALPDTVKKSVQKRAISVTGSFASNMLNLEFGNEFTAYDVDDGRSSRVHQNEDDDKYFVMLESELQAKSIILMK
jgi:hypothetical protein